VDFASTAMHELPKSRHRENKIPTKDIATTLA